MIFATCTLLLSFICLVACGGMCCRISICSKIVPKRIQSHRGKKDGERERESEGEVGKQMVVRGVRKESGAAQEGCCAACSLRLGKRRPQAQADVSF